MVLNRIIKIGVIVMGAILGAPLGELGEYILWSVGDYAVAYCETQNLPPAWHDQCINNLGNYNDYKPIFQLSGSIIGLIVGIGIASKLDFN